jgi:ferric enterobactin receptor
MNFHRAFRTATAIGLLMSVSLLSAHAQTAGSKTKEEEEKARKEQAGTIVLNEVVVLSAGEQTKQAPGVSNISAEDIEKSPPANDISEIIRKMPGVNLTGNTTTGNRGNQRQIDIRGMGPENTLILIDGKPVLSRNSVRFSFGGERDTRGDSNWVPAEAIERIEVLRGPAAARYGSGASGGVVNIITKRATEKSVSVTTYANVPEDSREGGNRRANVVASGPLSDALSYRIYGNISVTDPDDLDINGPGTETVDRNGNKVVTMNPAGREGVVNKDLKGLMSWQVNPDHRLDFEAGLSRQGNKYAGDTLFGGTSSEVLQEIARKGEETNRMTRTTLSATHAGQYGFGESVSYIQWERTLNNRFQEGNTGGGEGTIITSGDGPQRVESTLDVVSARSEFNIPMTLVYDQKMTVGVEYRGEFFDDPASISIGQALPGDVGVPLTPGDRPTSSSANMVGIYFEDNILVGDDWIVTPAVRFDYHDKFGFNASPSLNASWKLTDDITIKGGIARPFKAPNLFQTNPNYIYNSAGGGCPPGQGPCYILGNEDLDPEISVNKEIGINYTNVAGWNAGITYFHNDYKNKITTGDTIYGIFHNIWNNRLGGYYDNYVYRWENGGPGVIQGLEGNLSVPVLDNLTWSTNFTKMIESRNSRGQPYSLIPDYTINTSLEWQASEKLALMLSATHYGKIKPATRSSGYGNSPITGVGLSEREAYTIVNTGFDFKANENFKFSAGIKNLFDKKLLRTGEGANTYNEPGRSYYISLSGTF